MTEPWSFTEAQRRQFREAQAEAQRARAAARATRPPAPKKITHAKASRLVAIIVELQQCEDCPSDLRIALEDARAAISPWYDRDQES